MERSIYNFAAGPSALPVSVLQAAKKGLINWQGTGLSVMEMPFTSPEFTQIQDQAQASLKQLLNLPPNYKILFLQGGAYGQFAIMPMNLLARNTRADYAITGHWSRRAAIEASKYGQINVVTDTTDNNHTALKPEYNWSLDPGAAYCHITTNETADGVQFHKLPNTRKVPLIADATSDFLTAPIDISSFGALYASAQKNIGPAGLTIVIIREDLIRKPLSITPAVFDFSQLAKVNSKVNTLPTWAIYIASLMFKWILQQGGLEEMSKRNKIKARIIYEAIDNSQFYHCEVDCTCRSKVNVVFNLPTKQLEDEFIKQATERGFLNLKGHSATGAIRVSLYNPISEKAVSSLAHFMEEFALPYKQSATLSTSRCAP